MTDFTEDGRLVLRVRSGDLDALGALYEKYKATIFRAALAIIGDKGAAEDVLQETFLRLYAHADSIDTCLPLAPWLYRVAVNLSYTYLSWGRRWLVSLEAWVDRLIGPSRTFPEEQAELREVQRAVWQAIDNLEPAHRITVILYYLCNLSLREIAYATDCPVGTVKSRLHYGRARLRETLANLQLARGRTTTETGEMNL
jgi:RNA polymerase sigma-70 factor, ECF subfamily